MAHIDKLVTNLDPVKLRAESFRRGIFDFITNRDGTVHEKQKQALHILTDDKTEEFLFGGAAGGAKSWTGCTWLLFMCILYPDTNWFMGRKELKRITESTLKTFFKVCKEYGFSDYKYNAQKYFIKFSNGSNIDLLELKYLPSDSEYERFGSTEYTGGWIDEIAEIDFGAFDVLRTRIGRQLNDKYKIKGRIFATCNPTKKWPKKYFYDKSIKKNLDKHQKFLQSLVTDNPFIDDGYIERLERTTDNSKRERLLKGNWEYDENPNALCSYDDIMAVFDNDHIKTDKEFYLTADVARLGSDKAVILVWEGWKVVDYKVYDISLITEQAKCIEDFRYRYQIRKKNCIADQDGVGGGLVDMTGIEGFVNNASAKKVTMSDGRIQPNFKNYQTQCAYHLVDKINSGQLYIEAPMKPKYKEEIMEEFGQLQSYKTDDDMKVYMLPKREIKQSIGRSPDWRDAFLMRAHFDIQPRGSYFIVGL
jgi:phage terminase large subunit